MLRLQQKLLLEEVGFFRPIWLVPFIFFYFAWNSYGYEPTEIRKLHNLTT